MSGSMQALCFQYCGSRCTRRGTFCNTFSKIYLTWGERILLQSPNVEHTRQLNRIRLDLQGYTLILNDYKDIIQYLLGIAKAQTSTIDPLQRYNVPALAPPTPTAAPRIRTASKPATPIAPSPGPGAPVRAPAPSQGPETTQFNWKPNSRPPSYIQSDKLDANQFNFNSYTMAEEKLHSFQSRPPPRRNYIYTDVSGPTSGPLRVLPSEHFYTDLTSLVDKIIKEAEVLGSRIESARNMVFSDVAIRESITMRQLSYIAVIYLPATFAAGIFGMNVQGISSTTLKQYFLVALLLTAATVWTFVSIVLHGTTMSRFLWPWYSFKFIGREAWQCLSLLFDYSLSLFLQARLRVSQMSFQMPSPVNRRSRDTEKINSMEKIEP
ncbi:hypothetical protein GYMLUDRAFT_86915 [Collybiopsis luxurians FD-317 M1]|uniref:Magnesium transporter n=1 Tax=Collybiopsis luxurians FD-317 M1 TaxID=944289 RepID=A0A0D0BQ00_9AGAR|nr:hypothetical protein GYMLUDRAFT_86915 [Collybiopsis luxurians FD-317 M1]